jgi:hypothetical protein
MGYQPFFKSKAIYKVVIIFIFLGTLLNSSRTGLAAGKPISLEEYQRELINSIDTVIELKDKPHDEISSTLEEKAYIWEGISAIALPEGEVIPIDTSYLVALLRADEPSLSFLKSHLITLFTLQRFWPERVFDSEDADYVQTILARPEFQWAEEKPNPLSEWINRVINWFLKLFKDLFPSDSGSQVNIDLSWLYYIGSTIFIIFLLYYVFRGTFANLVSEAEIEDDTGEDKYLTAEKAIARAHSLSRQGDLRQAVRYLYLSALFFLEENGVLKYEASKTNREYVQSIADRAPLARSLNRVVETFDKVWYGFRQIDEAAYSKYEEEVKTLRKQK